MTPIKKAWMFFTLLLHPTFARRLGTLVTEGYLARTGWVRSVIANRIVDEKGAAVPWMSLPFIGFIAPRLNGNLRLFEYGSGASTVFFSKRVGQVCAVEHDAAFAAVLMSELPPNVKLIERSGEAYWMAIREMQGKPNVVVVDGIDRAECVREALAYMENDGILILDDSERTEYETIRQRLKAAGFKSLDFWGVAPTRIEHRCTTVFYRSTNVLDI